MALGMIECRECGLAKDPVWVASLVNLLHIYNA